MPRSAPPADRSLPRAPVGPAPSLAARRNPGPPCGSASQTLADQGQVDRQGDQTRSTWLSCLMCGSGGSAFASGEADVVAGEVEADQGDEGGGVVEAEGDAGEESDLGVDRFDPAVGQAVDEGVGDVVAVGGADAAGEFDERA